MTQRRELHFLTVDEVLPEVERLLAGHTTLGHWTLGQILHHLATAIRLSIEGPPGEATPTRAEAVMRRFFFRHDRFPEGADPPVEALRPPVDARAEDEAEELRRFLARFREAADPMASHPVLGRLSKVEWEKFHCMHCAHHLSFALPQNE